MTAEIPHDASYYFKCMIGGVLSCGITHTVICPLDIIKCRKQVNPVEYPSIIGGGKKILAAEGPLGLVRGWMPTAIGYSAQGLGKFGFYEIFKDLYAKAVGEENAKKYRATGWLVASACAQVIADVLLCPWEALKVRMQTTLPPATFTRSTIEGFNLIKANEGINGFYKSLGPLWARQVPYTMVKFSFFEKIVSIFYTYVFTQPKETYSKRTQLLVTFMSGYIAGVLCAIVSHPADTLVSKLNQLETKGSTFGAIKQIVGEVGFAGLWNGLVARIIMIGTLTGLQWWIYNGFKSMVGLPTVGGK